MPRPTTLNELWELGEDLLTQTFVKVLVSEGSVSRAALIQGAAEAHAIPQLPPNSDLANRHRSDPVHQLVESVFWEWTVSGCTLPRIVSVSNGSYIHSVALTEKGWRALGETPTHPLHPAFVVEVSDLPDDVRSYLEDASACLRHDLLRAAVVMVGLAFESTVDRQGQPPVLSRNAARPAARDKINALLRHVDEEPNDTGGKRSLTRALMAAESAAADRNDAAHPRPLRLRRHEIGEAVARAPSFLRTLGELSTRLAPLTSGDG